MKVGDVIFAREHFMRMYPEFESRRFTIEEIEDGWHPNPVLTIQNEDKSTQPLNGNYADNFYFFDDININKDIMDTLDRYEFQSFQGVTLEGKIVQLDLPIPNKKRLGARG